MLVNGVDQRSLYNFRQMDRCKLCRSIFANAPVMLTPKSTGTIALNLW